MSDISEQHIRDHCPHCDQSSHAFSFPLEQTTSFHVVCDPHPITEGHVLIIPKQHLSCIGEYPQNIMEGLLDLHAKVSDFIQKTYGSVASFEHGKVGQTVYHSHIHILSYGGEPEDIVPEGQDKLTPISSLSDLVDIYDRDGGYLFESFGNNKWVVDIALGAPRFFRDRFACALGRPELGNWKTMHVNEALMAEAVARNQACTVKYKAYAGLE